MGDSSRVRVSIAIVAAYMVALQALLLPLSVAAAGPFDTAICASHAGNSGPVNPTGCACAGGCGMQCCVHALAAPAAVTIGAGRSSVGAKMRGVQLASVIRPVTHQPHIPRAPPAA